MVARALNPSTLEVEFEVSLQRSFRDSEGYTENPCLRKHNKTKKSLFCA